MYKLQRLFSVLMIYFSWTLFAELSRIKLLMCSKKGFKGISINWLDFLVGHYESPTIGLSFWSLGSKISMVALFLVFIADSIILDLGILGSP